MLPADRSILLIRHGRSAHAHTGWITAEGFRAWREAYEAASIHEHERVPHELNQATRAADLTLSINTPRAIASARLMAAERQVVVSPLLRELDLIGPNLARLRMPLIGWALAVGARNLLLTLRGQYPGAEEVARIAAAADWLETLSQDHASIVVVTHASFRRQLADRLMHQGWQQKASRRSLRHWSAWMLRKSPHTKRG